MYKCHCGKEFETAAAFGGHKSSHSRGEAYKAGRKIAPSTFICLFCGKENSYGHSKVNKYCSAKCQQDYQWEFVKKPKLEQGHGGNYRRYLKEKYGDCCAECGQTSSWNNKSLTLQLDHIDGNSDNNALSNLRLLCPNCHSQTDTYGSKGQGSRYKKHTKRNKYLREYKGRMV